MKAPITYKQCSHDDMGIRQCTRICFDPVEIATGLCCLHYGQICNEKFTQLPLQIKFDFLFARIDQLQNEIVELKSKSTGETQ